MSGILDPKTRVIDTVITQEGKRQISSGGLRAVYATVSDKHSYYELDVVSGSTDATRRLHYEAPSENNNDSIIMEHDDSGGLLGYPMSGPSFISNDGSVYREETISSETTYRPVSTPSIFASTADEIIGTAIDRFTNLQTIGTRDPDESLSLQMKITPTSHTFTVNNKFPFVEGFQSATTNLEYVEPLFFDEMLANSPNFQFLPPVTEPLTKDEQRYITAGYGNSQSIAIGHGEDIPQDAEEIMKGVKAKIFGAYTKYQRPAPMDLEDIMNHLNLYPELRRMTDHSGTVAATATPSEDLTPGAAMTFSYSAEGETTDSTEGTMTFRAYAIRDPDADGDEPKIFHWYGSVNTDDMPPAEPLSYSGATAGKATFGIETNNDAIGVYKSEIDSSSVNLTTEQLPRERVQVFFNPTSSTNNIIMQMFEVNSKTSKLLKLDVIHYGEFSDPAGIQGSMRPTKNLFFAGKILVNSIGLPTFINLFTIILD